MVFLQKKIITSHKRSLIVKTYQTLTLIGGIFGIVVVPIILYGMLFGWILISWDANLDIDLIENLTAYSTIISIVVSISAIVIVFVMKEVKTIGYVLLGFGAIMLFATNMPGIIPVILFFVGGMSAIKHRNVSDTVSKK